MHTSASRSHALWSILLPRMRRLPYLAWLSILFPLAFYCWLLGGTRISLVESWLAHWSSVVGLAVSLILFAGVTICRLKDIGAPPSLAIIPFAPLVGLLFTAILAALPGSKGANPFGDVPTTFSRWLDWLMWAMVAAFVIACGIAAYVFHALRNLKFM